jgi:hypothetical protein
MSAAQNSTNSRRLANEAQLIGNSSPPNMSSTSEQMLKAASPLGFNLLNTRTDNTASDAAAKKCRTFTDIKGLRDLQKEQINRTYYEAGCGWRYRPSNGIVPEINQAAAGTAEGPLAIYSGPGGADEVTGGTKWYWDLNKAERDITTNICQSASQCKQLSLLGDYSEVCGYCKSTGAMIPVQKNGSGYTARYNDNTLGCPSSDIVTASTGKCEGFVGQPRFRHTTTSFGTAGGTSALPSYGRGDLAEAFTVRRKQAGTEGYANLDALDQCNEPPLSRDCVILAARTAGCSDEGTLIAALNGTPANSDYDSVLKQNSVYTAYNSVAVPRITSATLKDGSVSLATALGDFKSLMKNTQNNNRKLALSARDLCIRKGEYDAYDFCSEMAPTTIIDANSLKCVQQAWLNEGGTVEGTLYPGDSWKGKTYQSFVSSMNSIKQRIHSNVKETNAQGLMEFIGTSSGDLAVRLPKNENTRGAETVWFELGEHPVILRCDLRLAKDKTVLNGEVVPFILGENDVKNKYKMYNPLHVAYTSAFEIRSDIEQTMNFGITTTDGFMLSVNQNPFEGTVNRRNDWGSWMYQSPNVYYSGKYRVNSEDSGKTNTVVTKWFTNGKEPASHTWIQVNPSKPEWTHIADAEVYLTQEPLAPWMQFEVCTRPNDGQGNANGFFEKRFNGPCAIDTAGEKSMPGFDVNARSIVIQTDMNLRREVPKKLPYITFTSTSAWSTKSYVHAGAVKTLTILVRPTATLSNNGGVGVLFTHSNGTTFNIEANIKNTDGNYRIQYIAKGFGKDMGSTTKDITMNEWNLIVIQYIGDSNGLRRTSFHVETLNRLKNSAARNRFSAELISNQLVNGEVIAGNPRANYVQNSGFLTLGSWNTPSMTGDVAWIHGFRNFLDTDELLKNEIEQSWVSRWPRGNLDSEITGKP